MPVLPVLSPREVVQVLERLGWRVARTRGSHVIPVRDGHPATLSAPNHREVARGTLRALIARAGLAPEEFLARLSD